MRTIATALVCLCGLGCAPFGWGQSATTASSQTSGSARTPDLVLNEYFGAIMTPCRAGTPAEIATRCKPFIDRLRTLAKDCPADAKKTCEQGKQLLADLFSSDRPILADYIVYIEEDANEPNTFKLYTPILMYGERNTPHLYGVRDIYALVFSQRKVCLRGTVTTEFKTDPNPFAAIAAALGTKLEADEPKALLREKMEFTWLPLSGNPKHPGLWFGFARSSVQEQSSGRITVGIQQPKKIDTASERNVHEKKTVYKKTIDKDGKVTEERTDSETRTLEKPKPPAEDDCSASDDSRYSSDFLAANAFFSNSPASRAGISVALGATFNTRNTSLSSGGTKQDFNGYAVAKYYFLRPELRAGRKETGYKMSVGGFVGTGIKNPFDEIVTGLSVGHLFSTHVGVLLGFNYIKPAETATDGRKWRPFVGLDYSF